MNVVNRGERGGVGHEGNEGRCCMKFLGDRVNENDYRLWWCMMTKLSCGIGIDISCQLRTLHDL